MKQLEYSIFDVLDLLTMRKHIIIFVTVASFLSSIVVALILPTIYESKVLLAPASKENQLSGAASFAREFASLGAIAGLNLPSNTTTTGTALAILQSRNFLSNFVSKYNLAPILFSEAWDTKNNHWLPQERSFASSLLAKFMPLEHSSGNLDSNFPTSWDKYRIMSEILSINSDTESGLITLSIKWKDPDKAAAWANLLVSDINDFFRKKSIKESKDSISYLENQLQKTGSNEIRSVIYQLIEEHTKTVALASVKNDFVFEILDPAITPDEKISPKRKVIVLIGLFFGFSLGCLISLWLAFYSNVKRHSKLK